MKKLLASLAVVGLLAGCASTQPVGALYSGGNFYNGATVVDASAKDVRAVKTGKACATSVLSLVAVGDNSVASAKRNGMITKVSSIDYNVNNVLGLYGSYCTVVKGE